MHLHGATAWYAIFQFLPDGIRRGSLKVELFLDVRLGNGGKITFGYFLRAVQLEFRSSYHQSKL